MPIARGDNTVPGLNGGVVRKIFQDASFLGRSIPDAFRSAGENLDGHCKARIDKRSHLCAVRGYFHDLADDATYADYAGVHADPVISAAIDREFLKPLGRIS